MSQCDRKTDRNTGVLLRHHRGETHASIARVYGISRERVRQIVKMHGAVERRKKSLDVQKKTVESAFSANKTKIQIAMELGVTEEYVGRLAKKFGIKLKRKNGNAAEYEAAAILVADGISYSRAALAIGAAPTSVKSYCLSIGVHSIHKSKNPMYRNDNTRPSADSPS